MEIANFLSAEITGPLNIQSDSQTYFLRRMDSDDLHRVCALEKEIFPSPWSLRMLEEELKNTWSIAMVVEFNGEVMGYLFSWIVADELHITNIAISFKHRRLGISEQMLVKLIRSAAKLDVKIAHLEVRRSNIAAIKLYRKLGFEIVGVREGYYEDENEDALLMSRKLKVGELNDIVDNKIFMKYE